LACILTGFLAATITSFADQPDFAGQARAAYGEAAKAYHESPLAAGLAWKFARACYDVADYATNNTERAAFAEEGITACRNLISKDPRSVSAHYYLGMNLAQLARTKGIAALKIVNQMRDQFVLAQELDPAFDHAGPDRNLGLLYHEAPSWISIGNRSKSHHHLQAAVDIAPDYPENHLNLAEACLAWGDRNGAKREFKALEMIWETAHATYSGVLWASSWLDWERRFAQLKNKIAEPSRAIESPRRSE
jgi:tetratricopeptide (TPR) repeat protein